jgi:hypothetical protein
VQRESTDEISTLFRALIRELDSGRYALTVGSESPVSPYVHILGRPHRTRSRSSSRPRGFTLVRLSPARDYLAYLDTCYPRLYETLRAGCNPDRPFLVIERWSRHVDLGERLLRLARTHDLNLRCVDYARGESRLNGLRVVFDRATYRWRAEPASVEDLLRDFPLRHGRRDWVSVMNPRWPVRRAARRLSLAARRAAAFLLT